MNMKPREREGRAKEVAEAYFDAWRRNDLTSLSDVFAADVRINGSLGKIEGANQYQESLARIFEWTRTLVIHKQWITDGDVMTWFDLHPHGAGEPFPVASWLHVEDGLITRVRVTFDLSKLLQLGDPRVAPR